MDAKRVSFLAGIIITLIGLLFLVASYFWWRSGEKAKTWPSIAGKMVRIENKTVATGKGTVSHTDILYEYVVNGEHYSGNRLRFGLYQANRYLNEVVEGSPVVIYYNPTRPEESTLYPGSDLSLLIPIAIGLGFIVLGSVAGVQGRRIEAGKCEILFK